MKSMKDMKKGWLNMIFNTSTFMGLLSFKIKMDTFNV
jgi:hypothetical protein